LTRDLEDTELSRIRDFAKYPELVWLNRWWMLPPVALGTLTYFVGGFPVFVWAFCVCQVMCWHGTFTINSLSHLWGGRRYVTEDDSRNNPVLAIITMGEGWHNNHHHYQVSARQGFFWWEVDATYYALRALAAVGVVWDLHGVPDHILADTPAVPAAGETADMA
jgi:stearoyl-CoA desaturase (delta-9 desaturase)